MADRWRPQRPWLLIAAVVALLAIGGGSYVAVNAGSSLAPAPTATPTATAPAERATATATPTEPPASTATSEPPTATATPQVSLNPGIDCPKRTHFHLNIDNLAARPGLAAAVVTEIDDRRVRLELEGVEFIIDGWGEAVGLAWRGDPSDELRERVQLALDAVRYEC